MQDCPHCDIPLGRHSDFDIRSCTISLQSQGSKAGLDQLLTAVSDLYHILTERPQNDVLTPSPRSRTHRVPQFPDTHAIDTRLSSRSPASTRKADCSTNANSLREKREEKPSEWLDSINHRIAKWQTRLLQLNRRNSLLYFKPGRSAVGITGITPDALDTRLRKSRTGLRFPYVIPSRKRRRGSSTANDPSVDEEPRFIGGDLVTDCELADLQRRLRNLQRRDREWEEEQGLNVLFLALERARIGYLVGFQRFRHLMSLTVMISAMARQSCASRCWIRRSVLRRSCP